MNLLPENTIASPCIRNCCLDLDDVCLGCHRHIDEITAWHSATEDQKIAILRRCDVRKKDRANQHSE